VHASPITAVPLLPLLLVLVPVLLVLVPLALLVDAALLPELLLAVVPPPVPPPPPQPFAITTPEISTPTMLAMRFMV
jgi:hypothetical protein